MLVIVVSNMDTEYMLFSGRKSYQLGLQSCSTCLLSAVRILFDDLERKPQKRFFSGPESAEITLSENGLVWVRWLHPHC
jgi:hypothetical protein